MGSISALVFSIFHLLTFALYNANYSRLRKNDRYKADGRLSFYNMPLARKVTKFAFSAGTLLTLFSFWYTNPNWGFFDFSLSVRGAGLLLTFCSFLLLKYSLGKLGENYSPIFDNHKPRFIVKDGIYRYIRHPVYLSNMLIILGYLISSSSLWVLITSLWGWGYMLSNLKKEEKFLSEEFPEYREYQKKSAKLIPRIF